MVCRCVFAKEACYCRLIVRQNLQLFTLSLDQRCGDPGVLEMIGVSVDAKQHDQHPT